MSDHLISKLKNLPDNCGVYQFKNEKGKVIYVGKAKNLKHRIRNYFSSSITSPKTLALVKKIFDFELILTDNEIEALVLENNLIKELKPRYNINLKDDKSFPFIKITNEMFPRIYPTRRIFRDGSKYFGPYTDVKNMKSSLRMINQIFKIRSCKLNIDDEAILKKKFKICLDYHIKKCDGPCEGLISKEDYKEMVGEVLKLLNGRTDELINELKSKMNIFTDKLEFEKAAEIRDKIHQLSSISSKQKIVSDDFEDRDIIAAASEEKDSACSIFNIRMGKLIGKKQLKLNIEGDESLEEIYAAVLKQYYGGLAEIPKEIVLETMPHESEIINEFLNFKSEKKVKLIIPKRESKLKSLVKMCKENAILQLKEIQLQKMKREENIPYTLAAIKRDLKLDVLPKIIECFDISNLQGTDSVASLIVFENGKPKKSQYRKFIIKEVKGPDDFASMREVIERRFSRLISENKIMPDLIMVDGGKGQLSSAVEVLNNLYLNKLNIVGLAKRLEEIFIPNQSEPIILPKTSSSLKLLQQIRDEAHRFAITFHRLRRNNRIFSNELMQIKGIGKKTNEKLLKKFGSINEIKNLDFQQLEKAAGKKAASLIFESFHNSNND